MAQLPKPKSFALDGANPVINHATAQNTANRVLIKQMAIQQQQSNNNKQMAVQQQQSNNNKLNK